MSDGWKNKLYFGDNLDILRRFVPDESVDLIYLDPPFNSNATYNVLFAEQSGERSAAQIKAFDDTWHWGIESEAMYHEVVTQGPKKLADLLQALRAFLGQNDMMAYLTMMSIRLVELHRVLKPTGSLYLHCDTTASHYIKLICDAIFGPKYFKNEIIWKRTSSHNDPNRYGRIHDVILFYTKSSKYIWNPQYEDYNPEYIAKEFEVDNSGRPFKCEDLTAPRHSDARAFEWRGRTPPPGREWRYSLDKLEELWAAGRIKVGRDGKPRLRGQIVYLDEKPGKPVQDLWTDILRVGNTAAERLGYPTQKPEALLERIIKASSNEGDLVLDPFCGCGTTLTAAERLSRRWIGIDITHLAIALMRHRLHDSFRAHLSPYEVIGAPKDLAGARALAAEDRYQFQWWVLGLVDARPAHDQKKGADTGIDGYLYFFDDNSNQAKAVIVQVKSGHVSVSQIRDLKGVLEREKGVIGAFITLEEPTREMIKEAATAGFYEPKAFPGRKFPRVQILTVKQLLEGETLQYPNRDSAATFKKAPHRSKSQQDRLL